MSKKMKMKNSTERKVHQLTAARDEELEKKKIKDIIIPCLLTYMQP